MDTGISVVPDNPWEVPEYECREAATYTHIPWSDWPVLTTWERAKAVAHYRLNHMIKAHVDDASQAEAKKQRAKVKSG